MATEKTEAFYKDIFDIELVMEQGWMQVCNTESDLATRVNIISEKGICAPVPDLFIEVENVETALFRVNDAKFEIVYGPVTDTRGICQFYVRDPFGKLINVYQGKKKAVHEKNG
ncbi:MAG: glyoxalase [Gammaproteobacteria bacterium]|nr:MAG: glyoxalase [Gammaproteobacteria bacterium]